MQASFKHAKTLLLYAVVCATYVCMFANDTKCFKHIISPTDTMFLQ